MWIERTRESGAARLTNSEENASPQSRRVGTFGWAELLEWLGARRRGPPIPGNGPSLAPLAGAVSLRRFEDKRWRNFRGPQSCSSWWSFTSAEDRTTETAPRRAETGPPVHARRVFLMANHFFLAAGEGASKAMDRWSILLRTTGFDPAALTLSRQLLRYGEPEESAACLTSTVFQSGAWFWVDRARRFLRSHLANRRRWCVQASAWVFCHPAYFGLPFPTGGDLCRSDCCLFW